MTIWRCSVCGYEHHGPQPPEECPVCHAPRSAFAAVVAAAAPPSLFGDLLGSAVPHAIAAHFPNGLLPTALAFLGLAWLGISGWPFEAVCASLLAVTALTVPATFVTGLLDWRHRFGGRMLPIFRWKIGLGLTLIGLSALTVGYRFLCPVCLDSTLGRALYTLLVLAMLATVTALGHLGGKLTFHGAGRDT